MTARDIVLLLSGAAFTIGALYLNYLIILETDRRKGCDCTHGQEDQGPQEAKIQ